jgi:hypothetical protein
MLFCTAGCKISVGSFFWFPYEDAAAGCECRPQLPRKSKAAFAALCRAGLIFLAAQTSCSNPLPFD